ncbi:hypothetical protein BX600DRAFT_464396 [Xylariales sp. PMI_506]|nr:hypothetical protein BX600DRAFT_464396 [Xylariales sp. PMI_506]
MLSRVVLVCTFAAAAFAAPAVDGVAITKSPTPCSSPTVTDCTATAPTICVDYFDNCGQTYGGCFPDCNPWPSFTAPPCSISSTTTTTTKPTTTTDCSALTVCEDFINECGQTYGGCFSACTPWPTFTPPPCSLTTTTTTTTPSTTDTCTGTICRDYFETCSNGETLTYGGCLPACVTPTYTPPPCPTV